MAANSCRFCSALLGAAEPHAYRWRCALNYTVEQLLRTLDRAPRSHAASPVFRMFLRIAAIPRMGRTPTAKSTRALLTENFRAERGDAASASRASTAALRVD